MTQSFEVPAPKEGDRAVTPEDRLRAIDNVGDTLKALTSMRRAIPQTSVAPVIEGFQPKPFVRFYIYPAKMGRATERINDPNGLLVLAQDAIAREAELLKALRHASASVAPVEAVHARPDIAAVREVFLRNGFTIKPGQSDLKLYVYEAAWDLLRTFAAPAVQGEAGKASHPDDAAVVTKGET